MVSNDSATVTNFYLSSKLKGAGFKKFASVREFEQSSY